ncbi:MAG: HD domain-containing protein [Candidatus Uhrbacteria bacterium]
MSDKKIEAVVKKLAKQAKVFYVGGFVRDFLLGEKSKDIDLEVYGLSLVELEKLLKKNFGARRVKAVGKSFNVLHVSLSNGYTLDVSLPRRDSKVGRGHRGIVAIADLGLSMKDAARRRDFTINAMLMDPLTGQIFDFFGGQADLKNKVLRMVEAKTFVEDPLRVLRAVQFASRFDLVIDDKTVRLIKKMVVAGALAELSAERVREEIDKLLLKSKQPSYGLELLRELGILKVICPELLSLKNCFQEPSWHPEGDVWEHTKLAVDAAAKLTRLEKFSETDRLLVLLATLFHDVGKPTVTKEIKGRVRAIGHSEIGEKIVRLVLSRWRYSNLIVDSVGIIIREHRWPPVLLKSLKNKEIVERRYIGEIADLLRRLGPVSLVAFLTVCEADYRGKKLRGVFVSGQKMKQIIQKYKLSNQPLLLGRDVLSTWQKIKKAQPLDGRLIGKFLKTVEEKRRLGKILTKTEAKKFLAEEIKKIS